MALSDPRIIFGVHSVAPYSRSAANYGSYYGIFKVLGGSSLSLSGELLKLNGGSLKYPWAVEDGLITAELSLKVKEYPSFLFELFLGKAPTDAGIDAAGSVSTPVEVVGASIIASTGIATITVIPSTGAANLKFGKYLVKAASATAVDIYVSSDINFARGTDETYDSDILLVSSGNTITTGGNTDIASLGLRITGGAGAIAFVTGDSATFLVLPPSTKSMSVTIGASSDVFPEFGAMIYAKQRGNLEMFEVDLFRCKGVGTPLGFEENAFSEAEIKAEAFYDSAKDGIMSIRHILPSS
jgi:hypothetical protein